MKTKTKTTLLHMLQEMETWVRSTPEELAKAKTCGIHTGNSKELRDIIKDWTGGAYDEDPETVKFLLMQLIN